MISPTSTLEKVLMLAALVFGVLVTACVIWQSCRITALEAELAKEQAAYAAYRAEVNSKALQEETKRRTSEIQLQDEVNTNALHLQNKIDNLQRNRSALAADNQRLRQLANTYATYSSAAGAPASFASAVEAGNTRAGVLADMLGRIDEAAGVYAAEADESRVRGRGCEAAYGAAREATMP